MIFLRKTLIFTILASLLILVTPVFVFAQENSSTTQDEAKGKQIWEQLQSKQINCGNLKDDDFELLGEYFMGQSIGNTERHTAMNQMMTSMMGEQIEKQMHITLGERYSGCTANASFPQGWIILFTPLLLLALGVIGLIALRKSRFLSRA